MHMQRLEHLARYGYIMYNVVKILKFKISMLQAMSPDTLLDLGQEFYLFVTQLHVMR